MLFLQYLFNGFTEKKKYEIEFELENAEKTILLKKGEELNNFIDKIHGKQKFQIN